MIQSSSWIDVALALIEIVPGWKLRRLAYDDGEWHCSLSKQPNLPVELSTTPSMRIMKHCHWQSCRRFSRRGAAVSRARTNRAAGPFRAGARGLLRQFCLKVYATRMSRNPDIPHELASAKVLARFLLRIIILAICAAFGREGFGKTIEQLLTLATCYCIASAASGAKRRSDTY